MGKTRRDRHNQEAMPIEHGIRRRDIERASRDIAAHILPLIISPRNLYFEIKELEPDEAHSQEQIYEILHASAETMVENMQDSSEALA